MLRGIPAEHLTDELSASPRCKHYRTQYLVPQEQIAKFPVRSNSDLTFPTGVVSP